MRLQKHWPLAAAILVISALVAVVVLVSVERNGGRLIYPLDDSYIHMAVARTAAEDGVWGLTPHGFTSSSSSPLWTAVLALGYQLIGVNEWLPLALAFLSGLLCIGVSHALLARSFSNAWVIAAAVLGCTLAMPLPAMIVLGMEHALHAGLGLAFVAIASRIAFGSSSGTTAWALMLLAPVLAASRYEGLFLIAATSVVLTLRRRLPLAIAVSALGALPPIVYGLWSRAQGWPFLPTSLLLKGQSPDFSLRGLVELLGYQAVKTMYRDSVLTVLVILAAVVLLVHLRTISKWTPAAGMTTLFLATTMIHLQLASIGWFYRYEAYLVLMGTVGVATMVGDLARSGVLPADSWFRGSRSWFESALLAVVIGLVLSPFAIRALQSLREAPQASHDRYLEHVLTAEWVRDHWSDRVVAANDVGALAFFSRCRILDLWGLGSLEPYEFRQQPSGYTTEDVERWTSEAGAEIAVLQLEWKEVLLRLPETWNQVALWRFPEDVVFKETDVGIFSLETGLDDPLRKSLEETSGRMPADLEIKVLAPQTLR